MLFNFEKNREKRVKGESKNAGRNFRFVLSLTFTSIALVAMLFVGAALYITFYRSMRETMSIDQKQILEQVNLNLDNYLRNMMKISNSMYFRVIKNANLASENIVSEMSLLYDANSDRLVSLAVFSDTGEVISAVPISSLKPTVDVTKDSWFIKARMQIENLHFSTPHVQNLFDNADYRYNWVVSLSRTVNLTYNGEIRYGVLLVDMNFSGIEQICRRVNLGSSGYVYIVDSSGEIIYHPMQQLIYANLFAENNAVASGYKDGTHSENFGGRSRFVTIKTVGYTGWKIVGVAYTSEMAPYAEISVFAAILLIFAISIMIFVNHYFSSRIADPIMVLERSVREIDRGRLDLNIEVAGGSYEVRHLAQAINAMLAQIRTLMDEIVTEHEQKRKSELDALQSQINPHFLYNAMDSIVWIIEDGEYTKAVELITALSRLFRISISKGRSIIPVKDELEHARSYLMIQDTRFANRFTFKIEATSEARSMTTIKLIVQPIIENAINHGIEYMDGDGLITINAYVSGEELFIEIADNGIGMPPETAEKLLSAPSRSRNDGSGIGLYNVQQRIQLYFGEQYGLTIHSAPDEGTRIVIRLPARKYEEGDK